MSAYDDRQIHSSRSEDLTENRRQGSSRDLQRKPRMTRRQFLQAAQLAVGTAALAALAGCGRGTSASFWTPKATPLDQGPPFCRSDTLAHVRRPSRLIPVADCVSVTGTLRRVAYDPHDGDYRLWVELDPEHTHLLAPRNNGLLMVVVIATDEATVYIPQIGEHATFYGHLALNRGHGHWVEIHPCWLITTPQVQGPLETIPNLIVEISAEDRVPVGQQWPVTIRVTTPGDGTPQPASQVHLFLELVSDSEGAVRWVAASTNTLGLATVHLASLVKAGDYTLQVYATKERQTGYAEHEIRIARR